MLPAVAGSSRRRSIGCQGTPTRLISEMMAMEFDSGLSVSVDRSRELLFAGWSSNALFIPQIAACVRF